MADDSVKIRVKRSKDGVTTVKALIKHPMETGLRKDSKTGKPIPAHFIQHVSAKSGEKTLMEADWSGGISKNPYLSFKYKGGQIGDVITIHWKDNLGNTGSGSFTIAK